MKHSKVRRLCFILAAVFAPALARADVVTFQGDTCSQGVFRRPLAGVPPLQPSPVGTAVRFEPLAFRVSLPGAYTLVVTDAAAGFDAFLHLYAPSFNPQAPLGGCLAGDDDAGPGSNPSITFNLLADAAYVGVVSGFSNADFGAYTLEIRGPGAITLIPTPGALSVLAFPALRRRRR